jgi:hypothetical protein
MNPELTDEQKSDTQSRKDSFIKEYEALVEKYQVDFAYLPLYVPVGVGIFSTSLRVELQDKKYLSTPSPIQNV